MNRGLFISFEGSEGCGKSTQIGLLAGHFRRHGREVVVTREPGGTPIGEAIRHLLQFAPEGRAMVPEAELLLFTASRAQLVRETIAPALQAGRVVLSDRFHDSTTVYQGVARRIALDGVRAINAFAVGQWVPDLTFVLDMDAAEAMRRLRRQPRPVGSEDRMEQEPPEFYEAVRQGYLTLARDEPARVRVIDAIRPPEIVAAAIAAAVEEKFHGIFQIPGV